MNTLTFAYFSVPYIPFYKNDEGGMKSSTTETPEIYYIGVIDFLQKYDSKKRIAGFAKSLKYEKVSLLIKSIFIFTYLFV